jgi:hypothetical protein
METHYETVMETHYPAWKGIMYLLGCVFLPQLIALFLYGVDRFRVYFLKCDSWFELPCETVPQKLPPDKGDNTLAV